MLSALSVAIILSTLPSAQNPASTPKSQTPPAPSEPKRVKEHVIVTASVAPTPSDAVSRTVTVLTREDLDRLGVSSIVEALRLVPGLDPRARGIPDVQSDFSMRGATFGQSLLLVDGLRLNDSQSGHHNGDLPIAVSGIDRVEVVAGGSSAVHGADALGGVVNLISRTGRYATATVSGGQYGTVFAQGSASGMGLLPRNWVATGWGNRSGGFTFDRDFVTGGGAVRGTLGRGWTVDVRHQRKAFGANGFYGNSPSKEWTDQTVVGINRHQTAGAWVVESHGLFRDHGDHFRWTIFQPGFAENQHRTNAAELGTRAERDFQNGQRLTIGGVAGGDWVRSTNLGLHQYARGGVFAELQTPVGKKTLVQTGLRLDDYATFGHSWNPSVGVSTWVHPNLRLRASGTHAFRIPTFTELYYHDPGNLGTPTLQPERGWSLDGGADATIHGFTLSVTPFRRWDKNVIDWVKAQPTDLWRSTNVRDVTTTGIEGTLSRRWKDALFQLSFTGLTVKAPDLTLLSKYVKEYARHSTVGSISLPIAHAVRVAFTLDHRHRIDGQSYDLVSARISRTIRRVDLFVDGTNLLSETYHEIVGVSMPGRWIMGGFTIR